MKTISRSKALLGAIGAGVCLVAACAEKGAGPARGPNAARAAHAMDADASTTSAAPTSGDVASGTTDGGALAAADAGGAAPLRWGTRPEPGPSPFSYVIDGDCVGAKVSFVDNAALVHYGEYGVAKVARATETGLTDVDALSRGLSKGTYFGAISGSYPDNLWYGVDVGNRGFSAAKYMHYTSSGWAFAFGADADANISRMIRLVAPLPKGALGVATACSQDGQNHCTELGIIAEGTDGPAPPLGTAGFSIQRLTTFASGDVWAFGPACTGTLPSRTCTRVVRRWKPGGKIAMDVLGSDEWEGPISVVGTVPTDVTIDTGDALLHFDGTSWRPAKPPPQTPMAGVHVGADGVVYVALAGKKPDGSAQTTNVAARLAGVGVGTPWAIVLGGKLARWDEPTAAWVLVPIPKAPFAWSESKTNVPSVEDIWVKSARDVWISATYTEWPSHWGEQQYEKRRAILRTLPPSETLRCTNRTVGSGTSSASTEGFLVSAPPLATPSCKTPLVLMGSVTPKQKTDFPGSRKIIAKHKADLAGTTFIDFTVGEFRWLGAKVPSYEVGKKLLAAIRADAPLTQPSMVCADPEGTAVDMAAP